MEWIYINDESEIPIDKTVIVEDCNGWMGQAYQKNGGWWLETFGIMEIRFMKIVRYFIVVD